MAKRYTGEELQEIQRQFKDLVEDKIWTILLVDPSTILRRTLAMALKKAGGENVLEAKDGSEGMALARQAGGAVVAVAELNLPGMDGIELVRQFRADASLANSLVIIMSAESRKERIIEAVKAGVAGYLKKPFEPQVLVDKLKSLQVL